MPGLTVLLIITNSWWRNRTIDNSLSFLQGTVIIIANHGDRIDIPAGALLENKIVSGNLRILDH